MKSRTLLTLVALILIAPRVQAGSMDKAKLRKLAELPKISGRSSIAVKNDPKDLDRRFALIATLLQRDDTAARKEAGEQLHAVEPLVKEANHKPRTVSFLVLRGIHAALSDRRQQAKESFKQALNLDKGEKKAARGLAALGEPLTPDDQQMAIDYLLAREERIERADDRPDAAVLYVEFTGDDITDEDLFCLTAFPRLRELFLSSRSITDAGMAYVEGRTTLQELTIGSRKITDKGLARLKSLANLRSLNLDSSGITVAGLVHLEAFQKLEQLSLPLWSPFSVEEAAWEEELAHLRKLPNLREVSVFAAITDRGLAHLAAIPRLESLNSCQGEITDEGMKRLRRCTGLRTLRVHGEQLTDAGLVHLKGLRHLRELHLDKTKVTGAGLVHLKGLTELEVLDLSDSAITDAGLANLSGLTNLRVLNLSNGLSMQEAIHEYARRSIPKLRILDSIDRMAGIPDPAKKRAKPQITDAGLKHLRGLTKLTELDLSGLPITDSGLTQLTEFKSLRRLEVHFTKVTRQGADQLRKAIPDLKIFR